MVRGGRGIAVEWENGRGGMGGWADDYGGVVE